MLVLGALIALFGHRARRAVSALSLGAILALSVMSSPAVITQSLKPIIAGAALIAGLIIGFLLSKLSIILSTSIIVAYSIPTILDLRVPQEIVLAIVPILVVILYQVSGKREFIPYLTLGTILFLWSASQIVNPGVAIPLAILVGSSSYVVQGSYWRYVYRYEKILKTVRSRRSKTHKDALQTSKNQRVKG